MQIYAKKKILIRICAILGLKINLLLLLKKIKYTIKLKKKFKLNFKNNLRKEAGATTPNIMF